MHHTLEINPGCHSIGNVIVDQLLQGDAAAFCAYKVPHPLATSVEVTVAASDRFDALRILRQACDSARKELGAFDAEVRSHLAHGDAPTPSPSVARVRPQLHVRVGDTVSDASIR